MQSRYDLVKCWILGKDGLAMRIVIADDHELMRAGIKGILRSIQEFEVELLRRLEAIEAGLRDIARYLAPEAELRHIPEQSGLAPLKFAA
jgi:hypothetical protein